MKGNDRDKSKVKYYNDNLYTNLHLDVITNKELLKKKKRSKRREIYTETFVIAAMYINTLEEAKPMPKWNPHELKRYLPHLRPAKKYEINYR